MSLPSHSSSPLPGTQGRPSIPRHSRDIEPSALHHLQFGPPPRPPTEFRSPSICWPTLTPPRPRYPEIAFCRPSSPRYHHDIGPSAFNHLQSESPPRPPIELRSPSICWPNFTLPYQAVESESPSIRHRGPGVCVASAKYASVPVPGPSVQRVDVGGLRSPQTSGVMMVGRGHSKTDFAKLQEMSWKSEVSRYTYRSREYSPLRGRSRTRPADEANRRALGYRQMLRSTYRRAVGC